MVNAAGGVRTASKVGGAKNVFKKCRTYQYSAFFVAVCRRQLNHQNSVGTLFCVNNNVCYKTSK